METVLWLQSLASPALDAFFTAVTMLGSGEFYAAMVAIVYWCIDRRAGFRMGLLVSLTLFVNAAIKDTLRLPRPAGPELRLLAPETGRGYGFPSGHAQGTTAAWAYLYTSFRRRWLLAAGMVIVLLVGLSRLYLGLHYPADVVGGVVIGLVFVAAFRRLTGTIEAAAVPPAAKAVAAAGLPLLALLLYRTDDAYRTMGAFIGMAEGYLLQEQLLRFREKAAAARQVTKIILGLAGLLAIRGLTGPILPDGPALLVRYGLMGFWAACGAPLVFRSLRLTESGVKRCTTG